MEFSTTNPATGKVLKTYKFEDEFSVSNKVQLAAKTFEKWAQSSMSERSALISKLAVKLKEQKFELAHTISLEMGKVKKEAIAEIEKCAWLCEYYATTADQILKDEVVVADGISHFVRYEPLGVVLSIMPWNFPFWQALRFAVPTILAGNSTLLKHSNAVPECAEHIVRLFQEAGAPTGLMQKLLVNHQQIESILKRPEIKGVSLTGSTLAGKEVGKIAGQNLKKVVLELGGSDPFIVLSDADLEKAVTGAMLGRFLNCGQSCIAAKRFIVHNKVASQFSQMLLEQIRKLSVGEPWSDSTTTGPLINRNAVIELEQQVQDAITLGAKLITGGHKLAGEGFYFQPTLLTNITPQMKVFREEVFGPVAPIIEFNCEEEAIALANNTIFGLGASVWSNNVEKATSIASKIECGTVFVNSFVKSDPRMPFGGSKESGLGRELSTFGLKEFCNIKSFSIYK